MDDKEAASAADDAACCSGTVLCGRARCEDEGAPLELEDNAEPSILDFFSVLDAELASLARFCPLTDGAAVAATSSIEPLCCSLLSVLPTGC